MSESKGLRLVSFEQLSEFEYCAYDHKFSNSEMGGRYIDDLIAQDWENLRLPPSIAEYNGLKGEYIGTIKGVLLYNIPDNLRVNLGKMLALLEKEG